MNLIGSDDGEPRPCPNCGRDMVRGIRRRAIRYGHQSAEIDQPAWWCGRCGEGLLDANDAVVADREFARIKSTVDKGAGGSA